MKDFCEPFRNKKITVLGLGLLGRGVGDTEFLAECGAQVLVTDMKSEEKLAESVSQLKKYSNVTFHLGGHRTEDFTSCDMVVKAAGVPLDSPEIAAAHATGKPVCMSTALFAKYAAETGATVVGVTGTRGKSTVAHMIFHALKKTGKRTHLGGNIRGKSTLAMLSKVQEGDICILELDSWQLQGFGDLQISPHIAVITNLMPDHLNYYKGDMDMYFADKANIFRFQKPSDVLIANASITERIRASTPPLDPIVPDTIPNKWKLRILGTHNRENATLAVAALVALGLSEEESRDGLESFEGVEGRLQLVREVGGVKIYNDNNATTPEATIAALRAIGKNIILIAGGADKGLDMSKFVSETNERCVAVVLLSGSGTDSLLQATSYKLTAPTYGPLDSIDQAVSKALELAKQGDAILFSPAFASFGMFKNEYDRNDQFLALVDKLAP